MCTEKANLDVKANILKHIAMLKPRFPRRAVISIDEYAAALLLKDAFLGKSDDLLSLFIKKTMEDSAEFGQSKLEANNILRIEAKVETHYWFNVQQYIAENEAIIEKLRSKPIDKLKEAILVAATSEGAGSALLPDLAFRLKERNIRAVGFAILPSQVQPPDAYFNALWSMATCMGKGISQVLFDRDCLEGYVGVDRKGSVLEGNVVLNYIIELALAEELFVQELFELSSSLNVKMFTVLAATGASLKVHGSLENILSTTLLRPFLGVDLSSASVLYVLVRMPLQLRDKLPRGKIELTVNKWFKEKANLKSVYVSEPIYVDDGSDRLDIVMFVGGFDLTEMVTNMDKKIKDIKNYAIKSSYIKEKEWQELIKSLAE